MKVKTTAARATPSSSRPEIRDVVKMARLLEPAHEAFLREDIAALKSLKRRGQALARLFRKNLERLVSECLAEKSLDCARRAQPYLGAWHNLKMIAVNISNLCDDFQIKIVEKIEFSHLALDHCRRLLVLADRIFQGLAEDAENGNGRNSEKTTFSCRQLIRLADHYQAEHEERLLMGICSPRAYSIFSNMLEALGSIGRYLLRLNNILNQPEIIERRQG